MACKRSGVRVSVAPLRDISAGQRHIRGLGTGPGPLFRHWSGPGPGCVQIGVSAAQRLCRVLGLALARWQEVGSLVGVFSQVSGMVFWLVTKLVTARPDVARCPAVSAPVAVAK